MATRGAAPARAPPPPAARPPGRARRRGVCPPPRLLLPDLRGVPPARAEGRGLGFPVFFWRRVCACLPPADRGKLRYQCRTLAAAVKPWMPVWVAVGGDDDDLTLAEALRVFRRFRRRVPRRGFRILVAGAARHPTGHAVSHSVGGLDFTAPGAVGPGHFRGLDLPDAGDGAWAGLEIETRYLAATYYAEAADGAGAGGGGGFSVRLTPGTRRIQDESFRMCLSLSAVDLPDTVTHVGVRAFSFCLSLTDVTLPPGLVAIGEKAFFSCSGLEKVVVPRGCPLASCGDDAFRLCESLAPWPLPDTVTSLGTNVFKDCRRCDPLTTTKMR